MNDGSHGWTLVAFPADSGEDWTEVARTEAERLLCGPIVLDQGGTSAAWTFGPRTMTTGTLRCIM